MLRRYEPDGIEGYRMRVVAFRHHFFLESGNAVPDVNHLRFFQGQLSNDVGEYWVSGAYTVSGSGAAHFTTVAVYTGPSPYYRFSYLRDVLLADLDACASYARRDDGDYVLRDADGRDMVVLRRGD